MKKQSKLNILFPIEVSKRELHAKVFMACKFAERGCNSYIGDKNNILKLSRIIPAVYFDKGYHKGISDEIYNTLSKNKCKVVSLDEENAVDFADYQQIDLRFPNHILDKFDLIFLWGRKQFDYLRNNRINFNEETTFISGHPRFDLLKAKYQKLYEKDTTNYKKQYGEFILVNTNFGLGNNINGDEHTFQNYTERFPQLKELMKYQKQQSLNFIDLCLKLSERIDFNIILRPHPEEDLAIYQQAFHGINNIYVISEGSVIPWILASELMIHHDCTTGLEAAMLGRNSIAYTKDLSSTLTTDIPLKISYQYDDVDSIVNFINQKMELKVEQDILIDYFSFNKFSLEFIIETTIFEFKNLLHYEKNLLFFKFFTNIKYFIRSLIKKKNTLYETKLKGFDYYNIKKIIEFYNEINQSDVKLKRINSYLFQIKL